MVEGDDYNCYIYGAEKEKQIQQIQLAIQEYLSKRVDNVLDAEFMKDFIQERLPEILTQYSFSKKDRL